MNPSRSAKSAWIHAGVIAALFALQFVLPDYHHLTATRVMVLAVFAMGFNVLFGYTGLLSLGHAMFFATGMYAAGMTVYHLEWDVAGAFLFAVLAGAAVSAIVGAVALRTSGVAFMIVTLMFSQVAYLATLYFTTWTRGDEGLVLPESARTLHLFGLEANLLDPATRYYLALGLLTVTLVIVYRMVNGPTGRALIAIRENEARTRMLGYNTFAVKLKAVVISGTISAASGAAYAILFAYVGSSFAGIQYSIDPLLYTLVGGAGTVLGPLLGSFLMFYIIDIASDHTAAYLLIAGAVLIILILYFPRGILGTLREKRLRWLP